MPEQTASIRKITAADPLAKSADVVANNIAALKRMFPEFVTEGANGASVNIDVLKQLIGDQTLTDAEEKFGLNWHGKRRARQLALTPSTGTLRPCPEESADWETTQNLFIEGDNLEVLKLLQKSYAGRVKLIYIDPPYNTGNDFVYPDDFKDTIGNYERLIGWRAEGGEAVTTLAKNADSSGRFHTAWLNMIYPRIRIARDLLTRDGVIVISIDDSELAHLKTVCDEIFGAENFVGRVTWERKRKGSHLSQEFVQRTESLLIFSRGLDKVILFGEAAGADEDQPLVKRTNSPKELRIPAFKVETNMRDQVFKAGRYGEGSSSVELKQDAVVRSGRFVTEVILHGPFVWSQENLDDELREGARFFIRTTNMSLRALKAPHRQGFKALSSFLSQDVGTNEDALAELAALFQVNEDSVPFDYPKPVSYLRKVVTAATHWDRDAIVVDFFAGSATTGQAVMTANAEDGGNRRYLLVQLPEPLNPSNKDQKVAAAFCDTLKRPRTIAELSKERLRRAGLKCKADNPNHSGDLGFRVLKLAKSSLEEWQPQLSALASVLANGGEHLRPDRSDLDLIVELLLKRGLDLCVPIEEKAIAGKKVHSIGAGSLIVCLDKKITHADGEALALGIAAWHKEIAPAGETAVIFRDDAFADDVVKTNVAAILDQRGLKNVRSL